ncbi:MAG TPA: hypothetical protein VFQ23_07770 [Anaerolineales bacterium]|nr:hypothetical protein [Anaerolineales bacterium]
MYKQNFTLANLIFAAILVGCAPLAGEAKTLEDYRMPTDVPSADSLTQTAQTEVSSLIPPKSCPVTTSENISFKAPEPFSPTAPWLGNFWYGSEHLWTALQNDGVWAGLPANSDGFSQKIMWWSSLYSLKDELEPALVVSGRRLDGEADPLRFYGATNAMADDIGEAMLTGVEIPTLGCWEITGQYKKGQIQFVVWVAQ